MANEKGEAIDETGEMFGAQLSPHDEAVAAIARYLRRTGWVRTAKKTNNGWEIWIDGQTLLHCTFPAAMNNQFMRDGWSDRTGKERAFSTGLANHVKATHEEYAALRDN